MIDEIKKHLKIVGKFNSNDQKDIESFRINYIGKKGILTNFFNEFKNVPNDLKKQYGSLLNNLKKDLLNKIKSVKLEKKSSKSGSIIGDYTRPGFPIKSGSRHPISIIKNRIIDIFSQIGFSLSYGPEIEDDWHNFSALNIPEFHPARDMQDTFFIQTNPDYLLRTHTSSVQIRYMEKNKPPIRTISPGRVLEMKLFLQGLIVYFIK